MSLLAGLKSRAWRASSSICERSSSTFAVQGGVGLNGRGRRRGPAAAAHREIAGFRRDPSGIGGAAPKIATVAAVYRRILTISLDLTMLGQDGQEPDCSATAGYKA